MRELDHRLHRDYGSRVAPFARGLDTWGNRTTVDVDIRLGGRIGPMWGQVIRYAKKTGPLGLFGPRVMVQDFDAVEWELRQALEAWLTEQESSKPRRAALLRVEGEDVCDSPQGG